MPSINFSTDSRQIQTTSQKMSMTPQMIQAIKIMALPTIDLIEKIYEEAEQNPALILTETNHIQKEKKNINEKASEDYSKFLEAMPEHTETLQEHLLNQIPFFNFTDEEYDLANKIVQNINDDGYFFEPVEIFLSDKNSVDEKIFLNKVLITLQKNLEPAGVCCENLQERLLLQTNDLERKNIDIPLLVYPLLKEFFHDLIPFKLNSIKTKLTSNKNILEKYNIIVVTSDDITEAMDFIKNLDPHPASIFAKLNSNEKSSYIIPDVLIRKSSEDELKEYGEDFVIEYLKGQLPEIKISKDLKKYEAVDKNIKKIVNDAEFFISAIEQRKITIMNVTKAIFLKQKAFFIQGPGFLQPLRMKDIAEELEISESTVSRIANEKYIQCNWGIFEIKYFFTNAINTNSSEGTQPSGPSQESVKQEIKKILENSEESISDSKLTEILASRGIKIARRTVNKYRRDLNIDNSYNYSNKRN